MAEIYAALKAAEARIIKLEALVEAAVNLGKLHAGGLVVIGNEKSGATPEKIYAFNAALDALKAKL